MKFKLRINGKMLLYILGTTIVVYVLVLGYAALIIRSNSYNNAHQILEAQIVEISNNANKKLSSYIQAVTVTAQIFSNYKEFPEPNRRELFAEMLYNLLEKNTDYQSVWSIWEPGILDSMDDNYKDSVGSDVSGNFKYVYYKQDNSISLLNVKSDSAESFYNRIYNQLKQTRVPTVIDPHKYSYGNSDQELLISNMVVPIMKGNQFLGIVGVDAPMMYVQQLFSNLKPMGDGRVFIISNNGEFLSHPESNYLSKTFQDYAPEITGIFDIASIIIEGKEMEFEAIEPTSGENSLFVFKPIFIGESQSPWSFVISVPLDTIYQGANKTFINALLVGLAGLIIVSLIILGIAFSISNPISKSTKVLQEISRGNIRNVEMVKFVFNDEINDMALAMNKLIEGLNSAAMFAQQIGEGYLNVDYKLLSENDALGLSLISMQKSLRIAKKAEEEKQVEDEKRNWVTHGLAKFGDIIRQHNDDMEKFTMNIIENIVDYLNVAQVAMYINQQIENENDDNSIFELKAAIAYGKSVMLNKTFEKGHELLGRSASENKIIYLENLPERYVLLSPGMQNKKRPNNLLIAPLHINDNSLGVIELLSYDKFEDHQIEFIEKLCENIASVVASVKTNIRTENLLEQSQQQADELAQHEEEMRQNLEEMEATQEEANKRQDELKSYLKAIKGSVMSAELDEKGRIIYINPTLCNIYGANLENMRGKYYDAFIAQDKKSQADFSEFWEKLTNTGFGKRKQKIIQRNKETWLLESYHVVKKNGLAPRIVVVVVDKTKEKELNDTLEAELKAHNLT